jgi:hypothetical protein
MYRFLCTSFAELCFVDASGSLLRHFKSNLILHTPKHYFCSYMESWKLGLNQYSVRTLDDWGLIPGRGKGVFLQAVYILTGCGTYPASYSMGTRCSMGLKCG